DIDGRTEEGGAADAGQDAGGEPAQAEAAAVAVRRGLAFGVDGRRVAEVDQHGRALATRTLDAHGGPRLGGGRRRQEGSAALGHVVDLHALVFVPWHQKLLPPAGERVCVQTAAPSFAGDEPANQPEPAKRRSCKRQLRRLFAQTVWSKCGGHGEAPGAWHVARGDAMPRELSPGGGPWPSKKIHGPC